MYVEKNIWVLCPKIRMSFPKQLCEFTKNLGELSKNLGELTNFYLVSWFWVSCPDTELYVFR